MVCAPRDSAPLPAAVTEATTASRLDLDWVLSSFIAVIDFSTASLNALLPAAVYCSAVDLMVWALVAMGFESPARRGWGRARADLEFASNNVGRQEKFVQCTIIAPLVVQCSMPQRFVRVRHCRSLVIYFNERR